MSIAPGLPDAATPTASVVLSRPPRQAAPPVPRAPVAVPSPPHLPVSSSSSLAWLQYTFPAVGSLGAVLFVLITPKPLFIAAGILFALTSVAMGVGLGLQQRTTGMRGLHVERERYLLAIRDLRRAAADTARRQRRAAAWTDPEPGRLWALARAPERVWERRRDDADFLRVRAGIGRVPLATPLQLDLPPGSDAELDRVGLAEARDLLARHAEVDELPLPVDLGRGVTSVAGPSARPVARALLAQVAALHAPDDVRIAICAAGGAAPEWEWAKWLPHLQHPLALDGTGPARLWHGDAAELLAGLGEEVTARREAGRAAAAFDVRPPHLLIVVDGGSGLDALTPLLGTPGISVLTVVARAGEEGPLAAGLAHRVATSDDGSVEVVELGPGGLGARRGRADTLSVTASRALARVLSPLRLSPDDRPSQSVDGIDLPRLLGVGDVAGLDPQRTWTPRPLEDLLRLPIGAEPSGEPVVLDLKESALGGMGPHGLLVGATGAGKSELLRTLVTGLAMTHPPSLLGFVLVDFKGGATFAGLSDLPHVAGMITNLSDDLALVDRVRDALFGEQNRRQELLRRAGNLAGIRDYQQRQAADPSLEPMPFLLVVVDEFGQLLAARPEFIELFVSVGRLGRSLGMHLLLASQQLDEGRLRGLEGHISYRICLRTFSAAESRVVLGVPDAYHLPPLPGSGYLKVDTTEMRRFRAALVSAPYRAAAALPEHDGAPPIRPFLVTPVDPEAAAPRPEVRSAGGGPAAGTLMGVAVERLRDAAERAHQVWLPPLEAAITLDQLLPGVVTGGAAAAASTWPGAGRMRVPLGLVDRPLEQAREVLVADLAGDAGHLAIVGAPQSGKSTLLRTLVLATALTHAPEEVWFHILDYGGGGLDQLEHLPHVGTVCGRADPERVRRMVTHVAAMLEEREQLFRTRGVDSAATLRTLRDTLPPGQGADVVLVVDNWPAVRQEHEDLEPLLVDIGARGLGFGVHLVLTSGRWVDVRSQLRDSIGGRLELRLNDPTESDLDRRAAMNVAVGVPGRGLTRERLLFQAALPRIDGVPSTAGLGAAVDAAVGDVAEVWSGHRPASPVRVLPRVLPFAELPRPGADTQPGVPVGVGEPDLRPVYLDLLGGDPHLLVYGDGESGKTSLLRAYLAGLCARTGGDRVQVLLVDHRMRLREAVPETHLWAYAGTPAASRDAVLRLRELVESRLPAENLSPRALRRRDWWTGSDIVAVVDDYDLVSTPSGNPLLPLVDVLAQGRDLGLHLVVTRRVGGASRAMFEAPLQRLRELGTPGIILSGDRQEGPLVGAHAAAPRPPGRGMLVRGHERPALVQVAWLPPPEEAD